MKLTRRGFLGGVIAALASRKLPKLPVTRIDPLPVEELSAAFAAAFPVQHLRVESLEATLKVLTFNQAHIKLWRDIPKLPPPVEAYTVEDES